MKNEKKLLKESVNKIKYLMEYDSLETRSENEEFLFNEIDIKILNEQDNLDCPNSVSYDELVSLMKKVSKIVRRMNTVGVRMINWEKRSKFIYDSIKFLHGKNTYDETFDECKPAIPAAISFFNGYFSDWFSKGETFEEELNQLIKRKYFRNHPIVQRYLSETVKLLKEPQTQEVPSQEVPSQQTSMTGGYKFVKGTDDDPYKYGKLGSGIAYVQQMLGFQGREVDGKWGPNTNAKMKEMLPDYVGGFTNDDLSTIIQTIKRKTTQPIAQAPTSQLKTPTVAPPIEKPKLA